MDVKAYAVLMQRWNQLMALGDQKGANMVWNQLVKTCFGSGVASAEQVELAAWKYANYYVVEQGAARLTTRAFIAQLVRTFGTMAGLESSEAVVARGAAGKALAGRLMGWPMALATVVLTLGCTSQNVKDQAQSRGQSYTLYNTQYLPRYLRWCRNTYRFHPHIQIPQPMSFDEFLENQNLIVMPH